MTGTALPDFDEAELARAVEALPSDALDSLPFGALRLDAEGIVRVYNLAERRLSGSGQRPRLGLAFFAEVAPCMNNDAFRGRIEQGLASGHLDVEFGWVGDFADALRSVRVRAQSAAGGGYWLFMQREDA